MKEFTTKELILGILLIPVMAAFILSGMAIANEAATRQAVTIFTTSTIAGIILILMIRHEGRRFYE